MNAIHGGYYDEENEHVRPAIINDEPVDLREQQELYAQAQHEAHLVGVRFDAGVEHIERMWDRIRALQQEQRRVAEAEADRREQQARHEQLRRQQRRAAEAEVERREQQARLEWLRLQQQEQRRAAEAEAERRERQARLERLRLQQQQEQRCAAEEAERRERQARLERLRLQQQEQRRAAEAEAERRERDERSRNRSSIASIFNAVLQYFS